MKKKKSLWSKFMTLALTISFGLLLFNAYKLQTAKEDDFFPVIDHRVVFLNGNEDNEPHLSLVKKVDEFDEGDVVLTDNLLYGEVVKKKDEELIITTLDEELGMSFTLPIESVVGIELLRYRAIDVVTVVGVVFGLLLVLFIYFFLDERREERYNARKNKRNSFETI